MVKVIVVHRVKNYEHWRPFYDADEKRRQDSGFKNLQVYRPVDDPDNLHIIGEAVSIADAEKMFQDQELAKIMEKAGVISQPVVTILNPA